MVRLVTSRWRAVQARLPWADADTARRRAEFTGIFQQNAWGDPESVSGPGSNVARASLFRADLEALVRSLKPRTLLDAPCGDFNWLRHFDLGFERYVGVDIVPVLIARNRAKFGSKRHRFLVRDMVRDRLPRADLIFCRDGLVHLSHAEIFATLRNFRRSRSTWLLTNTFTDRENRELPGWHPLNLQAPPFALPPPLGLIDEQCFTGGGAYRDKRLALWRLSDLDL
jgi:methyltransferase family protein